MSPCCPVTAGIWSTETVFKKPSHLCVHFYFPVSCVRHFEHRKQHCELKGYSANCLPYHRKQTQGFLLLLFFFNKHLLDWGSFCVLQTVHPGWMFILFWFAQKFVDIRNMPLARRQYVIPTLGSEGGRSVKTGVWIPRELLKALMTRPA